MSVKLEALSPLDGIGIIRHGKILRLIRPPYTLHESPILPEESVQEAILKHGFLSSAEQFPSWEDAIDFLNQQAVQSRRALGEEIPDSIAGSDILEVAPLGVLNDFLDRVETTLIPQRLFDQADDFLVTLLANGAMTRHPDVGARAAMLLQRSREARGHAEVALSALADRDVRFRSLERHHELETSARVAKVIRERGCVFAPGS
jgi:hypothetical protein